MNGTAQNKIPILYYKMSLGSIFIMLSMYSNILYNDIHDNPPSCLLWSFI